MEEKELPDGSRKTDFATLAYTAPCRDIHFTFQVVVMSMQRPAFDPFGEPVPAIEQPIAGERASVRLKTIGTSLFWALVVGIVVARAAYFEPGAFSFEHAVAWAQGLFTAL